MVIQYVKTEIGNEHRGELKSLHLRCEKLEEKSSGYEDGPLLVEIMHLDERLQFSPIQHWHYNPSSFYLEIFRG